MPPWIQLAVSSRVELDDARLWLLCARCVTFFVFFLPSVGSEDGQELSPILQQLATHIPDIILYRSYQSPVPQMIHGYGVLMFLDVSGH